MRVCDYVPTALTPDCCDSGKQYIYWHSYHEQGWRLELGDYIKCCPWCCKLLPDRMADQRKAWAEYMDIPHGLGYARPTVNPK